MSGNNHTMTQLFIRASTKLAWCESRRTAKKVRSPPYWYAVLLDPRLDGLATQKGSVPELREIRVEKFEKRLELIPGKLKNLIVLISYFFFTYILTFEYI